MISIHSPLRRLPIVLVLASLASAGLAQNLSLPTTGSTGGSQAGSVLAAPRIYPVGVGGSTQVVVSDFNADGAPDMAVLSPCRNPDCGLSGYSSVAVLLGSKDGAFQTPVIYATGTYEPLSLAVSDFNGDGVPDLAVASRCTSKDACGSGVVQVLPGNGDGTFREPIANVAGAGGSYFVAVGDFNHDGKPDLIVANQTDAHSTVNVMAGRGDGTFLAPITYSTGASSAVFVALGDFNSDGVPDLAVVNGGTQDSVSILLGNTDGTFQTATPYASGGALAVSAVVSDLNGDGSPDLVVVNGCANYNNLVCPSTGSLGVLLGKGDGTFQAPVSYDSGGSHPSFVAAGDFDGDGKPDLAVENLNAAAGGDSAGILSVLGGNGDGTFRPAAAFKSGGNLASSVAMIDLNGDGRPDLAVVHQCSSAGDCASGVAGVLLNSAPSFQRHANVTTLSVSSNPVESGRAMLLTAAVKPSVDAGEITGDVTFYDGAAALSTVPVTNGQATLSTALTEPGPHAIQAVYSGDADYAARKSPAVSVTVGTPVMLDSSLSSVPVSQQVTLTARVAASGRTPGGSITFMDGGVTLGSSRLVNGAASITTSALARGTHSITAAYGGDGTLQPGAGVLAQAVGEASATTVLSSANPATVNQPVTFKAKVAGQSGGVPSGTVAFMQGNPPTIWGTAPLANGEATITTAFSKQNGGATPVQAAYLGSPNHQASSSAALNQVVTGDQTYATTTTLSSSGTYSMVGQPVTFTASVTSTGGSIPDGETITFYNGSNVMGTGTTVGGVVEVTTSSLPVGTNVITAVYAGDATFETSTSNVLNQVVSLNTTATGLATSLNPSTYGQAVTFTATVTPTSGTGVPTGQITFKKGSTVFGTAELANGVASISTSGLASGSVSISAVYSGDASFATSTGTVPQVVNVASTTTTLTAKPSPSSVNQSVTFTATVSGQYSGASSGTVTFMQDSTTLGSVTPSGGKATFATSFAATGTYPITAVYSGDSNNQASTSSVLNQVVNTISTTVTVATSGTPALIGQPIVFTATVTPASGSIPDGETVTFNDGSAALGTGTTASGVATFTTSSLAVGTHNITAAYAGDATYRSVTSHTLKQVVTLIGTSTALTSSLNPAGYGQAVTFTATVSPASGSGTPTGKVTFKQGGSYLGTVTLTGNAAAFTTSTLAAGSITITASYSGDANYSASTTTITQVVNLATTATTLTSAPNPATINKTVTFTATVTAQNGGTLTGTVSFMQGSTTLGSSALSHGKATLSMSFPTAGTFDVTAVYGGDANNQTSTSSPVSQVVNNPVTTTVLSSSGSPAYAGQTVTFTAAVSSSYGPIPDGETVTFYDGSTAIGTGSTAGGTATVTTSTLTAGTHSMTATYAGDSTFQTSTSHVVSQVIKKNTVTIALVSSANPAAYGVPVTFTATVTSTGPMPTGTLTFKNGGVALGVGSLNPQGAATYTTLTLGAGSYAITISYSGDSASLGTTSGTLTQVVTQAATTLQLVSSLNPLPVGKSLTFTAIVRSATAFATGSVTFNMGATVLGTTSLVNGLAKLSITTLPSGSNAITATYAGTASLAGSSAALIQSVN